MKAHDPQKETRALQNRRVCYGCAFPISDPKLLVCPECQSSDISERHARPKKITPRLAKELPEPWNSVNMRVGGTVLLSGGPGSGKTTICMAAHPTIFVSSEQELEEVGHIWYRVNPNLPSPLLTSCSTWEQLDDDLLQIDSDTRLVVDSISQLASGPESATIVRRVIERIRAAGALAWFIAQFTKQGDMLGPNMLNHMVDVIGTIPDDPLGLRRLAISKNRFGSLVSKYFKLGAEGVGEEDFPYAYTVEGSAGKYSLQLYPSSASKMRGIFDELCDAGVHIEGMASTALTCRGYRTGFAQPNDVDQRRSFAEDHGLTWVSPSDVQELIQEHGTTKEA